MTRIISIPYFFVRTLTSDNLEDSMPLHSIPSIPSSSILSSFFSLSKEWNFNPAQCDTIQSNSNQIISSQILPRSSYHVTLLVRSTINPRPINTQSPFRRPIQPEKLLSPIIIFFFFVVDTIEKALRCHSTFVIL